MPVPHGSFPSLRPPPDADRKLASLAPLHTVSRAFASSFSPARYLHAPQRRDSDLANLRHIRVPCQSVDRCWRGQEEGGPARSSRYRERRAGAPCIDHIPSLSSARRAWCVGTRTRAIWSPICPFICIISESYVVRGSLSVHLHPLCGSVRRLREKFFKSKLQTDPLST